MFQNTTLLYCTVCKILLIIYSILFFETPGISSLRWCTEVMPDNNMQSSPNQERFWVLIGWISTTLISRGNQHSIHLILSSCCITSVQFTIATLFHSGIVLIFSCQLITILLFSLEMEKTQSQKMHSTVCFVCTIELHLSSCSDTMCGCDIW